MGKGGVRALGARCQLVNGKGTYEVTTPGIVTISRDFADMNITCEKPGMTPGGANVISTTKALVFGNVLIGGLIGVAIDTSSGAAYDYPELIRIGMGQKAVISGRSGAGDYGLSPATAATAPASAAASPLGMTPAPAAPSGSAAAMPAVANAQKPVSMDDLRMLLPSR